MWELGGLANVHDDAGVGGACLRLMRILSRHVILNRLQVQLVLAQEIDVRFVDEVFPFFVQIVFVPCHLLWTQVLDGILVDHVLEVQWLAACGLLDLEHVRHFLRGCHLFVFDADVEGRGIRRLPREPINHSGVMQLLNRPTLLRNHHILLRRPGGGCCLVPSVEDALWFELGMSALKFRVNAEAGFLEGRGWDLPVFINLLKLCERIKEPIADRFTFGH